MSRAGKTIRFDSFSFNLESGDLSKAGASVKLHPQPARILALLVQHAGEVVGRDQIQKEVWDDTTHVDFDLGINSCVRQIRTALGDDADHPRYIETVPRKGYRFVAPLHDASGRKFRKSLKTIWRAAAASLAWAVVGVGAYFLSHANGPPVRPDRVAVATFENLTGKESLDPVGRIAADWIAQGLSRMGIVEVVPTGSVYSSMQALHNRVGSIRGMDLVDVLARKTNAGIVVTGSYHQYSDVLEFQVQIADSQHGKLLAAIDSVASSPEQPLDAIERLRQQVMGAVAAHIDPGHEIIEVSSQPPSFDTYQLFIKGEEAFVNGDMKGAIELLEPIFQKSPSFLGHVPLLAMAYYNSGRWKEADSIVQTLSDRLYELSPHDVHKVEFLQARIEGNHAKALHAARHGAELDPDFLWLVGMSALRLNRLSEAREVLTRLGREHGETVRLRQWTPYWYHFSRTHHLLGDYEQELKLAREGRRHRPEDPQRAFCEVRALVGLGRVTEATRLLDESLALPSSPPGRWHPGRLLMETTLELRSHGYADFAEGLLERALTWYRSRTPAEMEYQPIRLLFAQVLFLGGREKDAEALLRKLLAEGPGNVDYRGGLGVVAACLDDHDAVQTTMAFLRNPDLPYLFGNHLYWRAAIAAQLGERQLAVDLLRQGFAQGLSYLTLYSRDLHNSVYFFNLRDYPPFQELVRPK